jgi:hypothetical protein
MPFTGAHEGDFSALHQSNWSRRFWADLAERTVTTAGTGVITMLTADSAGIVSGDARQWWVIVGLPAVLSVVKGIVANAKDSESGASFLAAPPDGPGPEVNPDALDGGYPDQAQDDEH